jgi:hypothetical protein
MVPLEAVGVPEHEARAFGFGSVDGVERMWARLLPMGGNSGEDGAGFGHGGAEVIGQSEGWE